MLFSLMQSECQPKHQAPHQEHNHQLSRNRAPSGATLRMKLRLSSCTELSTAMMVPCLSSTAWVQYHRTPARYLSLSGTDC